MNQILIQNLLDRWTPELNLKINTSLIRQSLQDKETVNSRWLLTPFGMTADGKLDYRGLSISQECVFHNLKDIDFSYCQFEEYGGFYLSMLDSCLFIGSKMQSSNISLSEKFLTCDFTDAVFQEDIGFSEFIDCNFENASMRDISISCKFVKCNFTNTNLSNSVIAFSLFENCIFNGAEFSNAQIIESKFLTTTPSDSQIATCSLDGVDIQ